MENDDIITNNEMMEKILGIMNNNDLPLSSKIEFLENKKVPATEILSIIKNTSSIVESPHSWSSNSSTWINVFSWATVVGAGLLTYYLSSEDEIMNENVETASSTGFEEFNQISCVSPASDMINNDGKKVNGELNHPELTKKMIEALEVLNEEVRQLKAEQTRFQLHQSIKIPIRDTNDFYRAMRSSIQNLKSFYFKLAYDSTHDDTTSYLTSSKQSDDFKRACGALIMYFKTALENPHTPRYRRIAIDNQNFRLSLGDALKAPSSVFPDESVCDELMKAVGFARRGVYYEWMWLGDNTHGAGAWTNDTPELTLPQTHNSHYFPSPSRRQSETTSRVAATRSTTVPSGQLNAIDIPSNDVAVAVVRECIQILTELRNNPAITPFQFSSMERETNESSIHTETQEPSLTEPREVTKPPSFSEILSKAKSKATRVNES